MEKAKIYIGTDHAGYELKEALKPFLEELGCEVIDKGASELTPEDDYPDYVGPVAAAVAAEPSAWGIVIGGSGQGEAMVANRIHGVRCAVYYGRNSDIVKMSREHNDANVLALGARFLTIDDTKEVVKLWLSTSFSGDERHVRRLAKF